MTVQNNFEEPWLCGFQRRDDSDRPTHDQSVHISTPLQRKKRFSCFSLSLRCADVVHAIACVVILKAQQAFNNMIADRHVQMETHKIVRVSRPTVFTVCEVISLY